MLLNNINCSRAKARRLDIALFTHETVVYKREWIDFSISVAVGLSSGFPLHALKNMSEAVSSTVA